MKTPDQPARPPDPSAGDSTSAIPPAGTPKTQGPGAVGYSLYDPARADRRHGPGYCGWTSTPETGRNGERR